MLKECNMLFEVKEVNFVGECGEALKKRLVFETIFTIKIGNPTVLQKDKKYPVIVFENGEYKAGFEYCLLNGFGQEMPLPEIDNIFQNVKDQINLWCVDLGYPTLQRNLFDMNRDIHLV